jgi:Na+-transporting methylmalonyl-CoA/oxaloacetate decarboxylase gamma subunit
MQLQAYIISKYFPEDDESETVKKEPLAIKYEDDCEEEKRRVAAIIGALIEHSKNRG